VSGILGRAAAPRCGFIRATSDRLRLRRNTRLEHESVVFDSRDIFSISNPRASRYRERRENARPAILALYFIASRECRPPPRPPPFYSSTLRSALSIFRTCIMRYDRECSKCMYLPAPAVIAKLRELCERNIRQCTELEYAPDSVMQFIDLIIRRAFGA